jgi:hypothetical protein
MSLTKESIENWIDQIVIGDDYFRHEWKSSGTEVLSFIQEENVLTVEYQFFDDGKAIGEQQAYLFDIDWCKEYDVYFPAYIQLVSITEKFTWPTADDLLNLSRNLVEQDMLENDTEIFEWGAQEIEPLIEDYLNQNDKEAMKAMLIEKYGADKAMPDVIPECLRPIFQDIISA